MTNAPIRRVSIHVSLIATFLLVFGLNSSFVRSQSLELTSVGGSLWRWMYEVKVASGYAYCGFELGLLVLDVTDPEVPTFVAQIHTPGGPLKDIAIDGDYAYLAAGDLYIVDISDPTTPRVVAEVDFHPFAAISISVRDGRAFIGSPDPYIEMTGGGRDGDVLIVDVSDPTNPVLQHTLFDHNSNVWAAKVSAIDMSGSRLLAAKWVEGYPTIQGPLPTALPPRLDIFDISMVGIPATLGSIELGQPHTMRAFGDLVVVCDKYAVRFFDISDITNLAQIGEIRTGAGDVAVSGQHAYIIGDHVGVYNIGSPGFPFLTGIYDPVVSASSISLLGDLAYVSDFKAGLHILDVSKTALPGYDVADSTNPKLVGRWQQPGLTYKIAVSGDYGYVIDRESEKMYVVDLSDPEYPIEVGSIETRGRPLEIVVRNGFAYIGEGDGGMQIVNVSDPRAPILAANYDGAEGVWGIDISGSFAYLAATRERQVQVVDISDPYNPKKNGVFPVPSSPLAIKVDQGYAYVTYCEGIVIYRIDNPFWLQILGQIDSLGCVVDLDVRGDYAYLADRGVGLRIIDVSNKELPTIVSSLAVPCYYCSRQNIHGIQLVGDRIFVTTDRVQVIDVADPGNPVLLATHLSVYPTELAVVEPYIYTTTNYGLLVLKVSSPTGIDEDNNVLPESFTLGANYPNPFNAGTKIDYTLPEPSSVRLSIFNILGQHVITLVNSKCPAGTHTVTWDGRDDHGQEMGSGVYFYRVRVGDEVTSRKMLMLK